VEVFVRLKHIGRFAAGAAALALVVTGCSSSSGGTASGGSSGGGGGSKCDVAIGFFGALTGDAANLGKNIYNGVELAVNQHNEKNKDCQVQLVKFDSQGSPDQAPGLAQQAINNQKVIGIVGPAFSGESKAADPAFNEAGLTTITPSATNPALATNGWKTFFRVVGNDNSQAPAAAKYIKDVLKAQKVFVVDDASEYGKGLADLVRQNLGSMVVGNDTIQVKQTDFSATVTKIKSSGADAVYFGGYYTEAGLLTKQMRDAGVKATFVSDDGVNDEGYIKTAGDAAAEGAVVTCPCAPPEKATGSFAADYQKAYGVAPGTYSGEGYDAATIFLKAVDAGKTSRADVLSFVKSYDGDGVTKHIKFDDKGEVSGVTIWAYKVQGGKIVPDQEIK
jgi:branched-chain amino acid transport system substrate-binding protein